MSASVSLSGTYAKSIAISLGIDVSVGVSKTWEAGTTVVAPNVPANMKVYMATFQDWEKITGRVDQWGLGGYAGESSYEIWKPLTPGVTYEYPFTPSSDGSPHPLP